VCNVARRHVPLRDDDATFPTLDAAPYPCALLEVLGACVDRVQRRRLGFAPVGDEAPSHRVHDERGFLRLCAADDGCVRARRDVVARHIAVSVHPLIDAESGVAVELFDLVCLLIGGCLMSERGEHDCVSEENSLEGRVRICRTWLLLSLACAGMADRCETAFIGATAFYFLLKTQSENMASPLAPGRD
jgi:hypothetical protein